MLQDTSRYMLVFDVARHGYTAWHVALVPLAMAMVFGALFVASARAHKRQHNEPLLYRGLAATLASGAFVVSIGILLSTWIEYR
jgi:hypothetical protein